MKPKIKHLLIITATVFLLAGCSTTHQPTQWEYKVVKGNLWNPAKDSSPDDLLKDRQAMMNNLGKDGWIFVTETDNLLYFKRPVK